MDSLLQHSPTPSPIVGFFFRCQKKMKNIGREEEKKKKKKKEKERKKERRRRRKRTYDILLGVDRYYNVLYHWKYSLTVLVITTYFSRLILSYNLSRRPNSSELTLAGLNSLLVNNCDTFIADGESMLGWNTISANIEEGLIFLYIMVLKVMKYFFSRYRGLSCEQLNLI